MSENFFTSFRKRAVFVLCLFAVVFFAAFASEAAVTETEVKSAWEDVCRIAEMRVLPLFIKEEKTPNAWVTAGKSVTVTRGLMNLLARPEEMFGVLSHEAGHVKLRHYQGRVGNAVGVGIAATVLGKLFGDSSLGEVAVGAGAGLATAGYSRKQEVEADDFAVDLAFKGGKDPTGIYTALERLSHYGGKSAPSGFSSHPPDGRRLRHVKERILARDPNVVFPRVPLP